MKRRNYESDFVAKMKLPTGLENIDFELIFSTNGLAKYLASRRGDVLRNCVVDADGRLSVVFKNHGLQPGMLKMKFISWTDNEIMPDGKLKVVTPSIEGVELVTSAGDECSDITFDIAVDYAIIDAYDMAVKAGYKGTKEEYIKMISTKPKSSASNILHRKCIRYNSPTDEIYSGPYLIIPNPQVGEKYNVVGLRDSDEYPYNIINGVLTVKKVTAPFLVDLQLKSMSPKALVKFNAKRELVINEFHHATPILNKPIMLDEIYLHPLTIIKSDGTECEGMNNWSRSIEVDIWKPVSRWRAATPSRNITQWVRVKRNGTAYSRFNKRKDGIVFLIRARRCNSRRTAFGDWHYFHVKDFIVQRPSRWVGKTDFEAAKHIIGQLATQIEDVASNLPSFVKKTDGILHISVSAPTSVTLDGKVVKFASKGEHVIPCTKTSKLSSIGANTIGIHRFDGIITTPIKSRSDVVFINNTTVEVSNMVWFYGCTNLVQMTDTIVVIKTADLYGLFNATHLSESPIIVPLVDIASISDLFFECRNLTGIPYFDTSKCTSFKNLCYRASALAALPLYDTSSATTIHGMLTECSIKIIPKFNFSNVTNITNAFGLMPNIVEFPNYFNFSKVTTATYAFNGDWGYYNEQMDTYQVGSIRRFPAYSFPVCTDLQGAWLDQSRMFSIGKLNIPACTNLDTALHGCFNLTTVGGFTGLKCNINLAHCKKLSVASMVNIFNEAANVMALGARTMTLGAVNLVKLTDAQKAIATAKGWTLA